MPQARGLGIGVAEARVILQIEAWDGWGKGLGCSHQVFEPSRLFFSLATGHRSVLRPQQYPTTFGCRVRAMR